MLTALITSALVLSSVAAPVNSTRTEHFTFMAPPSHQKLARELAATAEDVLGDVSRQLGVADDVQAPIMVRILEGDEAMHRAMPNSAVTEWAAGVAFPRNGLILLKADHTTRFNIHDVFRHEVSHIILARAVDHAHMPLWFIEGVAVHQAGEHILERWRRTANATLTDSVPLLVSIEAGFPSDSARVDLAYAQSTSFLTYLISKKGWPSIRRVIAWMRKGHHFHQAFRAVYDNSVPVLEGAWLREMDRAASWIPILADTTLLWILMTILFVMAWYVVRQRNQRRLKAMGDAYPDADDEFA